MSIVAAARVLFDQHSRTDLHWNAAERKRESACVRACVRACALTFVRRRCSCSKTFTLELTVDRNVTCPVSALCSRLYRAIPRALTSQCWNSFGNGRYRWIQLCYLLLPNFLFPFLVLQPSTQLISCRWPGANSLECWIEVFLLNSLLKEWGTKLVDRNRTESDSSISVSSKLKNMFRNVRNCVRHYNV